MQFDEEYKFIPKPFAREKSKGVWDAIINWNGKTYVISENLKAPDTAMLLAIDHCKIIIDKMKNAASKAISGMRKEG